MLFRSLLKFPSHDRRKERKERKKENSILKIKYLDSVFLSEIEYRKLQEAIGQKSLDIGIKQLDYSITVKDGKYKDHYKTILNWHERGFLNDSNGRNTSSAGSAIRKAKEIETDGQPYPIDGEY